jgi:predicted patatin/cPLA2 family phospholipase
MIEQKYRKYPAFLDTMRSQAERYTACREALFAEEAKGNILVIAPEDTLGCSRTERDLETLRALWQSGYFDGRRAAENIRAFWTE